MGFVYQRYIILKLNKPIILDSRLRGKDSNFEEHSLQELCLSREGGNLFFKNKLCEPL
jgi:hypothetical protein